MLANRIRPDRPRIVFISSNNVWGGSEELWSAAALALRRKGFAVSVFKARLDSHPAQTAVLTKAGCRMTDLAGAGWVPRRLRTLVSVIWPVARAHMLARLTVAFRLNHPALVVISQGINHDGWYLGAFCARRRVPYVMISQKATDLYWPNDAIRHELDTCFRHTLAALFVSEHNLRLTEEQLGFTLPHSRVVRNPFKASWQCTPPPWPAASDKIVLACLARLESSEKGQDMLLRVLAMAKWRARPIRVRFYGSGCNEQGLRAMARFLALDSVDFVGHVEHPEAIWQDCHALVLSSRCEGLPLSLIEAMLHARPAIVTDVGGNAEAMIDNQTGFLATNASEQALDEALERAWARRAEWPEIGRAAARHARVLVDADPAGGLADEIAAFVTDGTGFCAAAQPRYSLT
jgi:glycosyltransferase involved in cell wall biosynthesis